MELLIRLWRITISVVVTRNNFARSTNDGFSTPRFQLCCFVFRRIFFWGFGDKSSWSFKCFLRSSFLLFRGSIIKIYDFAFLSCTERPSTHINLLILLEGRCIMNIMLAVNKHISFNHEIFYRFVTSPISMRWRWPPFVLLIIPPLLCITGWYKHIMWLTQIILRPCKVSIYIERTYSPPTERSIVPSGKYQVP